MLYATAMDRHFTKCNGALFIIVTIHSEIGTRGGVVVKAQRYKPACRGFDSRWCHWNFSVT
jgi:hypothetical protein